MIIHNGTIQFKHKASQGINPDTGFPIKPTSETWGDDVECQFSSRYDLQAKTSGEPTSKPSFVILIDEQDVESEQIRLKDEAGRLIGEFQIKQVEPLRAVCQIRLTT